MATQTVCDHCGQKIERKEAWVVQKADFPVSGGSPSPDLHLTCISGWVAHYATHNAHLLDGK